MLRRLLPPTIDNQFKGPKPLLWLVGVLLFWKTGIAVNITGLNPFLSTYETLTWVDKVPMADYPPAAQATMLYMAASWGFAMLMMCCWGILVLWRYRAMVPLFLLTLMVEQLARKVLAGFYPIVRAADAAGTPAGLIVNWILMVGLVIAFAISVMPPRTAD